jgi:penicillin-binding protein 1C
MQRKCVVLRILLYTLLGLLLAAAGWTAWALADLPSIDPDHWSVQAPSIRITDREGRVLYEALTGSEGGRNLVVPLADIPTDLRNATIATEDKSFYQNVGVEPLGILRAFFINLQGGETLSGGSTITQQVARTLLMTPGERTSQTLRRKLREAVLAWQITRRYSKDEILALYLNQTYYGGMNYGVEAAAQTYFGKPAKDLSLAESALLAGLPQTPAVYNPFTNPDRAMDRRRVVLGLMLKQGLINQSQYDAADQEPLYLASAPFPLKAPHFVMMVRAQLDALYTPDQIRQMGGLVVKTSLDLNWQSIAEEAVDRQLKTVAADSGQKNHNMNDAAVVVLDPASGEIRAMVGSPDYFDSVHQGAINMAITPRQPGSALKPFIYALAFDPTRADPYTPATMILDVKTNFITHEGDSYVPADYNQQEHGPVLVRQALSSSLNIPAVAALNHVGVDSLVDLFQRMGLDTSGLRGKDVSIALGGGEISLLDLTSAYGVLSQGGCGHAEVSILAITAGDGKVVYTAPAQKENCVIDKRVAWLISDILSDDSARSLGFPANSVLNIGRPAAAKTGTTSNFHDNWTVGYTPDVVVGVWVGNASNQAMQDVTGLSGAGPIWHAVIRKVVEGTPVHEFTRPDGLVRTEVCSLSGLLPTRACPYTRAEWFIDGTQPTQPDTFYRQVEIDKVTGVTAAAGTPADQRTVITVLDLPLEASQWAREHGIQLYADLAGKQADTVSTQDSSPAVLIREPQNGSTYILSTRVPLADQQIRVEIYLAQEGGQVRLLVDGREAAAGQGNPFVSWLPMSAGKHTLTAIQTSADGSSATSDPVTYEVKTNPDEP